MLLPTQSIDTIDSATTDTETFTDTNDNEMNQPEVIARDLEAQGQNAPRSGHTSVYSCPECGGVLWQLRENNVTHFQCHTGHAYSPQSVLALKSQMLEATLWAAVRLLVEKKTLTRQMAAEFLIEGETAAQAHLQEMERLDDANQQTLREMLLTYPNPAGQAVIVEEALEQSQPQG